LSLSSTDPFPYLSCFSCCSLIALMYSIVWVSECKCGFAGKETTPYIIPEVDFASQKKSGLIPLWGIFDQSPVAQADA
jgi:hypothetical protein